MSEMPRNFDMRGNPSANPNLTSGRVEDYYEMGFPTVWAIQDMLANIRELNATVDQLKAAQSAPAPKVLYEGEASVLRDGLLLLTPGAMTILSVQKRVHVVVTAAEGDES